MSTGIYSIHVWREMKPNCVSGGQHKFAENGERSEKQRRRGEPVGISVRIGESAVAQSERQQIRGGGSTAVAAGIAVTCRVGEECACGESGAGSRDSGFCVASEWEGWGERSCFDTQVRKELQQLPSRRWPKHRQFHHGQQCLDQLLWEQYGDLLYTFNKTLQIFCCRPSSCVRMHIHLLEIMEFQITLNREVCIHLLEDILLESMHLQAPNGGAPRM